MRAMLVLFSLGASAGCTVGYEAVADPSVDAGTAASDGPGARTDRPADDAVAWAPCRSDADCDDGDPCTDDRCAADGLCLYTAVDDDRDGHGPADRGCGMDCDDNDPARRPGVVDGCNGVDDDCDGAIDEDGMRAWYIDCDGDTYAVAGAEPVVACDPPAPTAAGCGWTERHPSGRLFQDCDDLDPRVYPQQTRHFGEPRSGGGPLPFDYDCDGEEERAFTELSECEPPDVEGRCTGAPSTGWVVDSVDALVCGDSLPFTIAGFAATCERGDDGRCHATGGIGKVVECG